MATLVRRIWVQGFSGKKDKPLIDKIGRRFILLKIKCSKKNPKTYVKYFPFGTNIDLEKLKFLEGKSVTLTNVSEIRGYKFIYDDIYLGDEKIDIPLITNGSRPNNIILDEPIDS